MSSDTIFADKSKMTIALNCKSVQKRCDQMATPFMKIMYVRRRINNQGSGMPSFLLRPSGERRADPVELDGDSSAS